MRSKEEIQKDLDELGIIHIADANSLSVIEDAINAVKDFNKSVQYKAIPFVIDGETKRELFNSKEKILKYFEEHSITDIQEQINILEEAMGMFLAIQYLDKNLELENTIKRYLTYQWVPERQELHK